SRSTATALQSEEKSLGKAGGIDLWRNMDIPSIGAAIASGKALKNIIQGLIGLKVDTEALYRINAAQTQVSNLLGALLETQGDLFKLVDENRELRRQIQSQEDWEKKKAGYQL